RKAVNFFSVPDGHRIWARRARKTADAIVVRHGIQVVLTSSAPYSAHLIGMYLQKKHPGLGWVADFRDPMSTHRGLVTIRRPPGWLGALRACERRILEAADRVIPNTPMNRRELMRLFGLPGGKATAIPNGYDPEMLPEPGVRRGQSGKLELFYIGGLRGDWFEGPFYEALAILKQQAPDLAGLLSVNFVGADAIIGSKAEDLCVAEDIRMHGFVGQEAVGEFYTQAEAFLLILPSHDTALGWVPQKLYAYLHCRKPVLAVVPEGQVADYVRRSESGVVVSPADSEEIAKALRDMLETFAREGRLDLTRSQQAEEFVGTLSKPHLASEMLKMFRQLVDDKTSGFPGPGSSDPICG
ncbi:hypothetical protein LCGC14_2731510, partial [marine sediment metagenome]